MDAKFDQIAPLGTPQDQIREKQLMGQFEEIKKESKLEEAKPAQKTTQTTLSYIDRYCERAGQPGVFAEPLNLITNIAFLIGAVLIIRLLAFYHQLIRKNWDVILLSVIMMVIGVGSASFHSYPNQYTLLADVIPIAIFIHLYLVIFSMRMVGLKIIPSILVLLAFIGAGILFQKHFSPDTLNGTIMYVPTYLTLIIMVLVVCFVKRSPLYLHLINTAIIWTFSLAFRTIDPQLCEHTNHIGVHFLWHLLNAVVLYRLVMLLVIEMLAHREHHSPSGE